MAKRHRPFSFTASDDGARATYTVRIEPIVSRVIVKEERHSPSRSQKALALTRNPVTGAFHIVDKVDKKEVQRFIPRDSDNSSRHGPRPRETTYLVEAAKQVARSIERKQLGAQIATLKGLGAALDPMPSRSIESKSDFDNRAKQFQISIRAYRKALVHGKTSTATADDGKRD
jgi:hypothetical protein